MHDHHDNTIVANTLQQIWLTKKKNHPTTLLYKWKVLAALQPEMMTSICFDITVCSTTLANVFSSRQLINRSSYIFATIYARKNNTRIT